MALSATPSHSQGTPSPSMRVRVESVALRERGTTGIPRWQSLLIDSPSRTLKTCVHPVAGPPHTVLAFVSVPSTSMSKSAICEKLRAIFLTFRLLTLRLLSQPSGARREGVLRVPVSELAPGEMTLDPEASRYVARVHRARVGDELLL